MSTFLVICRLVKACQSNYDRVIDCGFINVIFKDARDTKAQKEIHFPQSFICIFNQFAKVQLKGLLVTV